MAASKSWPEMHVTLGALLRVPYEQMSLWVYARMAEEGFADMRPAFSAVARNLAAQGTSISDLSVKANMTKQSMGYLVDQMAECGFVAVEPHPTDKRAKLVRFTDRGLQAVNRLVLLSRRYEAWLAGQIGREEMKRLRAALTQVQAIVTDSSKVPRV
jgi:DNA-binding MarR family transcriptional regulator